MNKLEVRKRVILLEEVFHEGGPKAKVPLRYAAALAVVRNPFAGRYEEDIASFMDELTPLGLELADSLIEVLGGVENIEGYGKGAIVGADGELEHAALWHVPGGLAMRDRLPDGKAIVPSTKKVGGVGARLDVPMTHVKASFVRSHYDAMEVGVSDAPQADELLLALVMSTGPRIHARVGGLAATDIVGEDGLR